MNLKTGKRRSLRWFIQANLAAMLPAALITLFSYCDGIFPTQSKPDLPQDHTRNISGALHKPGLFEPFDPQNGCMTATCHGDDLRGGVAVSSGRHIVVPSCYECHNALWENGDESESDDD